jgi:hypothetical protein
MLKGTYVFKQNGVEVGRSENIVTNNGKTAILQYLTNSSVEWASTIAVGAIPTTPTVSDLSLAYEVSRAAVTLKSYTIGNPNLIVVKGTLSSTLAANIYEIGVFPYNTSQVFGSRDQFIMDDFSNLNNWSTTSGTAYTSNAYAAQSPYSPRVGLNSINLAANSTITNPYVSYNFSPYSTIDTINILANVPVGSSGTLNLTLTDINGVTSTFTGYSFGSTTGYQVISLPLPVSIFQLSTVSSISIQTVGSNSSITIDALRVSVNSEITNSTGLVSRSVLTTPIAVISGIPLDIEYYLQLG